MSDSPLAKRLRREDPSSRVVHVCNLTIGICEADLVEALSRFGYVSYVTCLSTKNAALVEFEVCLINETGHSFLSLQYILMTNESYGTSCGTLDSNFLTAF